MIKQLHLLKRWRPVVLAAGLMASAATVFGSSHREAPLIAQDPQADNTDVYAFRSPADSTKIIIIADYIPFQLPEGGPNYYNFSPNVRYEIHIKNNAATAGDDITYRFTFAQTNEDTTTFFNIRLGKQNQRVTYTLEKSIAGGAFFSIVTSGIVPPNNIGPRSITGGAGLGATSYSSLRQSAITLASSSAGERVFAGPSDDPFFVDLAGAFDVGNFRPENNTTNPTKDGLARYNVHSLCLEIPIQSLQKNNLPVTSAANILDPNFVIGVWASASRQQIRTINSLGTGQTVYAGSYVQVSRLGMPLTNEAIIPIGQKDKWNATLANSPAELNYVPFFNNPELALYMDTSANGYGGAVPSLNALRIQSRSLGAYDFRNKRKGLYGLKGNAALIGTALAPGPSGGGAGFGDLLLPDSVSPRAVDILPIFYTGVPNLIPYQLATHKAGGSPLARGKPFINNFLPTLGDMLRLNMAVPVTPRNSPDFNSLGIVWAAVLGLTDTRFNGDTTTQRIPNMDGFPNGRRLEDDVTTIELQAVSGIALAAIGLWYDDYPVGGANPVTPRLQAVLGFTAGPTHNDTTFSTTFPFVQTPWRGYDYTYQQRF